MLSKVSERKMHVVRWILVVGWLMLIVSLFYDPITHYLTDPNNYSSFLRDSHPCIPVQDDKCVFEKAYPIGTRIFWGMILPVAVFIVFVFGHETWRRICPLYFLSQIPRALGLKPRFNIEGNRWLVRNHFYLQFFILFIGLNGRILLLNSTRLVLGLFLIGTILAAITMVFLYGGRSWCHYVCPFGAVQTVFTGSRGLLGSRVNQAASKGLTQSMCRTVDKNSGGEKSACIGCKSPCMDIDSEQAYWNQLQKPGRKFLQYGYLGLAIGYFIYYALYAGNFEYYFSGVWTYENSLPSLWQPGFYLNYQSIAIPKIVAAPLTLGICILVSYAILNQLEKFYRGYLKHKYSEVNSQQSLHQIFTVITFFAFNAFFVYGGRPEILRLPMPFQLLFNALIVLVSTIWLVRNWNLNVEEYHKESLAHNFRRQLKKLPMDIEQFLNGRSLNDLKVDELFVLAEVLPQFSQQGLRYIYKWMLEEALTDKCTTSDMSFEYLMPMRQKLGLEDKEHYQILSAIAQTHPELLNYEQLQTPTPSQTLPTKLKNIQEPPTDGSEPTEIRRKKR